MSSTEASTDGIVEFLRSKQPELEEIPPDLDLIESRILDSLQFVEFMYFLEETSGRQIALEDVSAEDFRTLNAIRARFLDGA